MRLICSLLSALLLLAFSPEVLGQESDLFDKATAAYNEGEYDKAISHYQQILEGGQHSSALYFNMGNAHYKLGNIAPSIYYYEKALLLDPGDTDIQNNLNFAQKMTLDAIQPLPRTDIREFYETVLFSLDIDGWTYLGIGAMFLFVLGYILFYRLPRPNHKRIAFITGLVCLFLSLIGTAAAFLQYKAYQADQPAIVFSEEVGVQSEPNERSQQAFQLHEGTKVQVLDSLGEWHKIRIADGQVGWMPSESLRILKDF